MKINLTLEDIAKSIHNNDSILYRKGLFTLDFQEYELIVSTLIDLNTHNMDDTLDRVQFFKDFRYLMYICKVQEGG